MGRPEPGQRRGPRGLRFPGSPDATTSGVVAVSAPPFSSRRKGPLAAGERGRSPRPAVLRASAKHRWLPTRFSGLWREGRRLRAGAVASRRLEGRPRNVEGASPDRHAWVVRSARRGSTPAVSGAASGGGGGTGGDRGAG